MDAIDGLEELVNGVKKAAERGYIKSVDGRKIYVSSPHKALNYLLQSGAGIVAKRWMEQTHHRLEVAGIEAYQLAFIHDELQFETTVEPNAEIVAQTLVDCAAIAGEFYNLRLPIAAESKIGLNWAEVH